ncbi:MAG: hypothetical protein RL223_2326 [Pseudomonadota bacterium]
MRATTEPQQIAGRPPRTRALLARLPRWLDPRRSLLARFAWLIGGSGLAVALLTATVVHTTQRGQLLRSEGEAMQREARMMVRTLHAGLGQQLRTLQDIAAQPAFVSGLVDPGEVRLLLEAQRSQQPAWAWLALLSPEGEVRVATNALLQGADLSQERWFAEARQRPWVGPRRPAGALTAHLGLQDGQPVQLLDLGLPVHDLQGRLTGVLAARLRWDWLHEQHAAMLPPAVLRPGTEHIVLDRDDRVLLGPAAWLDRPLALSALRELRGGVAASVHRWPAVAAGSGAETGPSPGTPSPAGPRPALLDADADATGDAEGPDDPPQEWLTAWAPPPVADQGDRDERPPADIGIGVLVRQPAALAFAAADALRMRLLWVGLGGTVAFLLISVWLARRIARPVTALSRAAWRVARAEAPDLPALTPGRDDEVAGLGRALHGLHAELNQRLHTERAAADLLREQRGQLARTSALARLGGWRLLLPEGALHCSPELQWLLSGQLTARPDPRQALDLLVPAAQRQLRQALRAVRRQGLPCDLELRLRQPAGGCRWLRVSARAVRAGDGRIERIDGMVQDISDLRDAQDALHELNQRLEQRVAERTAELQAANAELDAFAYAVSHDLRAPLRAMSGFAIALEEDHGPVLPADARLYLAQIVEGSRRMGELIEGLLALSRSVRGVMRDEPVDLSRLAGRALDELRKAEPGRVVEAWIEPGLQARGDPRMLAAVLDNLVGNAWKYTRDAATACIRVQARTLDGERWLEVRDNGAGFDMAHAGRLFKAFARLHRQDEFPGLGIGLATVQRIVQRHGGRLLAEGRPGQGAAFRLTLPGLQAGPDPATSAGSAGSTPSGRPAGDAVPPAAPRPTATGPAAEESSEACQSA